MPKATQWADRIDTSGHAMEGFLADKSTRLLQAALSRAATEPAGLPLFTTKAKPGLFPPSAAARQAAQRGKDEAFLRQVGDACVLTDKGRSWLLNEANPRQVLEDFLRVLEEQQTQTAELLTAARKMCGNLGALKTTIEQLRAVQCHHLQPVQNSREAVSGLLDDILNQLQQWHADTARDCPLPELFHALHDSHPDLTIGRFHDALRMLHDRHRVYLHPWTGPLYDLPDPPFALLIGHEIAYYASTRT